MKRGAIFGITSQDEEAEGYDMILNKPLNGPHIRQAFEEYTQSAIEQHRLKLYSSIPGNSTAIST